MHSFILMQQDKKDRFAYLSFTDTTPYRRYVRGDAHIAEAKTASPLTATAHGSYGAALLHPKWKEKRQAILTRDGSRCRNCGSGEQLQVHHRQYHFIKNLNRFKQPWAYDDHLLVTLCEACNTKGHSLYTIPTLNV